jgi:hypothetical protein
MVMSGFYYYLFTCLHTFILLVDLDIFWRFKKDVMRVILFTIGITAFILLDNAVLAQPGINALRRKLEEKADEAIYKAASKKKGASDTESASEPGSTKTGRAKNKGGEGLVTSPPDVKENLADAEKSFQAGSYGAARYAVQQAMLCCAI